MSEPTADQPQSARSQFKSGAVSALKLLAVILFAILLLFVSLAGQLWPVLLVVIPAISIAAPFAVFGLFVVLASVGAKQGLSGFGGFIFTFIAVPAVLYVTYSYGRAGIESYQRRTCAGLAVPP